MARVHILVTSGPQVRYFHKAIPACCPRPGSVRPTSANFRYVWLTVIRFPDHPVKRMEPTMTSWKDRLALTAQRNRQEIVKAKLNRREMMRLGLLTAGGALIA